MDLQLDGKTALVCGASSGLGKAIAATLLGEGALLRASHIKPWADCEEDAERLDVFNGLLLAPHLDAAFDQGFITVRNDGEVIIANALDREARALLGLDAPLNVAGIADGHRTYLPWHREEVFLGQSPPPRNEP